MKKEFVQIKKQYTFLKRIIPVLALVVTAMIVTMSCDEDNDEDALPTITSIEPAAAAVGETVTITGTNFSNVAGNNAVWFSKVIPATVVSATETSITVTVPEFTQNGPIAVKVDGDINKIALSEQDFVFNGPFAIKIKVQASSDDAEEGINGNSVGAMDLGSSDLEFGEIEGSTRGQQMVGIRFADLGIPQGANITSASIQFTVDEDVDTPMPVEMTIYGEAADNAATYEEVVGNISDRPLTTASISWSIPEWQTVGEAGGAQRTGDLKNIVQEVVNRSGWTSASSLNFIFKPTTKTLSNPRESGRVAESSSDAARAPELTIEYTKN